MFSDAMYDKDPSGVYLDPDSASEKNRIRILPARKTPIRMWFSKK